LKKHSTQIVEVDIDLCIPAEWNYKKEGTEEEYEKLIKSITKDGSVGVLAAREVEEDGKTLFEIMDGNHRLEAANRMGWKKLPIENFGQISKADAITIARRRNHNWFEDDRLALMHLMNEEVLTEITVQELAEYMPESVEELEAYKNIAEFDWTPPEEKELSDKTEEGFKSIHIKMPEETYNLWLKWMDRLKENIGEVTEARAFEFAVIEAMNIPEEDLRSAD
jgi:hypothetical protein